MFAIHYVLATATVAVLAFLPFVSAGPTLKYSLMSQEPPVARVGSAYSFSIFPSTFHSASTVSYAATGLPSWLSWNSPGLSFTGQPSSSDVGNTTITLTATDSTGSTSSSYLLIVTENRVPGIHQSFTSQINDSSSRVFSSATALPGGTGVSVPSYWSFSLGWSGDTFRISKSDPNNGKLYITAHERGTTSLPSWLNFDNDTMTFSGVAPSTGSYTIVVTGSDYWGYSGATTSFLITVGEGEPIELLKNSNLSTITTMAGSDVNYNIDASVFRVGGEEVSASDLTFAVNNTDFSWLSSSGNTITGKCPYSYINGTTSNLFVPITVGSTNTSNTYELVTWVAMAVTRYYFTTNSLPNTTISAGSSFAFDITPYVANSSATIAATVNPTEAASWLVFHQDNWTLTGSVPASPSYDTVDVTFNASLRGQSATATYAVLISGATSTTKSSGTAAVPNKGTHGKKGISKAAIIALAVILPILFLILLAVLIWLCCCRKRRQPKEAMAEGKSVDGNEHDDDSFYAGSPNPDPFRRSRGIDPQPDLISKVKGLGIMGVGNRHSQETPVEPETPKRMEGMRAIFNLNRNSDDKKNIAIVNTPPLTNSPSFLGHGDVIGVDDPHRDTILVGDTSSFTQSFDSESSDSRASWESPESFQWSTSDHGMMETPVDSPVPPASAQVLPVRRMSSARSIPRPRANFVPRYPRHSSPTRLAQLASQHSLGMTEIGQPSDDTHGTSSHEGSELFTSRSLTGTGSGTGSLFNSRGTGLGRFNDSAFPSIEEDSELSSDAIVTTAQRASAENPRPTVRALVPRLGEVNEHRAVHATAEPSGMRSRQVSAEEGVFSDAGHDDSDRFRMSAVSAYPETEDDDVRHSTMSAIPLSEVPFSPPLPSVGSFVRPAMPVTPPTHLESDIDTETPNTASTSTPRTLGPRFGPMIPSGTGGNDGRVFAMANETFSIHPQINPPPTVSLSAATWSSGPPSTYRAEIDGGGKLPSWLRFDARDLELWGVPALKHNGQETVVRIIETLPRSQRGDPMSFGYQPPQQREVGRVHIVVVDRAGVPGVIANEPHAL